MKRVHEQDDEQTIKRLRAQRDRFRAIAGEQSNVIEGQKENIAKLENDLGEKSKEVEELNTDIRSVSKRQLDEVTRREKSAKKYDRALKTSTDYAESNKTQYELQKDQTKRLTRTISDKEKVIKELRAMTHTQEERIKELETSCKSRRSSALLQDRRPSNPGPASSLQAT